MFRLTDNYYISVGYFLRIIRCAAKYFSLGNARLLSEVSFGCNIVKILNLLYHAFMYSLLILLSSIYPFMQCHPLLVAIICYRDILNDQTQLFSYFYVIWHKSKDLYPTYLRATLPPSKVDEHLLYIQFPRLA